jgi:hypothetical protein
MNTPWLKLALFSLVLAPGCFSDNADFCDVDEQCSGSQVCNAESNTCEAAGPAGEGADAGAPDEEVCDDSCLPSTPEGWTGPVARADAPTGEELPGCSEVFSEDLGVMNSEIIEQGSCDCECGDASGLSCGSGSLNEWTQTESTCELGQCNVIATGNGGSGCFEDSISIAPNSCVTIPDFLKDEDFLRAGFGTLSGGSCSAPSVSGELSSAFGSQTRLCQLPAENEGCESGEVCAPEAPADFAEGLCIVQEGEHECPIGSGFTERTVLFTGIDDQRSCDTGSCSCDAPTGSCGGKIELHNGGFDEDRCTSVLATLQGSTGFFGNSNFCQALPAAATTATYLVDLEGRDCRRSGEAGITGESVGTGASTLCCMP